MSYPTSEIRDFASARETSDEIAQAIWMMRALVASNVLSRREDTVLFVPINPNTDPQGDTVIQVTCRIYDLAKNRMQAPTKVT